MFVCSSECVFSYHGDDCTQQLESNSWPDPSTMRPLDTYIVNNGDSVVKIYIQLYAALSSAYELMNPTLDPSVDTVLFYESGWGAFGWIRNRISLNKNGISSFCAIHPKKTTPPPQTPPPPSPLIPNPSPVLHDKTNALCKLKCYLL